MLINKRIINALILLLLVTGAMAQNVTTDNSFRIGKLKNGMTYYIRHNAKEKGIADFYIAQRVGSILEEPNQRGLAHFLEHMASMVVRTSRIHLPHQVLFTGVRHMVSSSVPISMLTPRLTRPFTTSVPYL